MSRSDLDGRSDAGRARRRAGAGCLLAVTLAGGLAGCGLSQPETDASPTAAVQPIETAAPPKATAQPGVAPAGTTQTATTAPATSTPATVSEVVDGDTVRLSDGRRVRVIGIDTPERGQCGYEEATAHLETLVLGRQVALVPGATSDADTHGRLLRYLDVDGLDAGRDQIAQGLAVARYDSRDGYGRHPRETDYVSLDAATPDATGCDPRTTTTTGGTAGGTTGTSAQPQPFAAVPDSGAQPGTDVYFRNCAAARAAGAAPLHAGQPGYRSQMDGDGDGVACE